MRRLMILDSGAFSVWNRGESIDLEEYVAFCVKHPDVSYYVNLDVIPGEANRKRTLTKDGIEDCCRRGWDNYQRMLKDLPKDKVIPVFHQNDHVRWLDKYLSFGTPYVGISPANDMTTRGKLQWMDPKVVSPILANVSLKRFLFDGAGRPVVKTHGFAVTSFALMRAWEWHSVDSASWKMQAAMGSVYLPQVKNGAWDYTRQPFVVGISPMSTARFSRGDHLDTLPPSRKESLLRYLDEVGVALGKWTVESVGEGYRPAKGKEFWYDKSRREVLRVVEPGAATNWEVRAYVNSRFIRSLMEHKAVPVEHVYFAGAPRTEVERHIGKRLMTFNDLRSVKEDTITYGNFRRHLTWIRKGKEW